MWKFIKQLFQRSAILDAMQEKKEPMFQDCTFVSGPIGQGISVKQTQLLTNTPQVVVDEPFGIIEKLGNRTNQRSMPFMTPVLSIRRSKPNPDAERFHEGQRLVDLARQDMLERAKTSSTFQPAPRSQPHQSAQEFERQRRSEEEDRRRRREREEEEDQRRRRQSDADDNDFVSAAVAITSLLSSSDNGSGTTSCDSTDSSPSFDGGGGSFDGGGASGNWD